MATFRTSWNGRTGEGGATPSKEEVDSDLAPRCTMVLRVLPAVAKMYDTRAGHDYDVCRC